MNPKTNKKETTPVQEVASSEESLACSTDIIPVENELVKQDADIDGFLAKRSEFIAKVNAIMVEKQDYHIIQGKKSLAKGGAEKIASIFHWTAKFEKDGEALEMLGGTAGLVAFKCTLMNGQFVGEGRGATTLAKNSNDPNKTLKMAQKSAFIDAVLRASGLSDFFTQDLEDMPREQVTYAPQRSYNNPTYTKPVEAKPVQRTINDHFMILSADIKDAGSPESLTKIASEVRAAFANKKITLAEFNSLTASGKMKREELVKLQGGRN